MILALKIWPPEEIGFLLSYLFSSWGLVGALIRLIWNGMLLLTLFAVARILLRSSIKLSNFLHDRAKEIKRQIILEKPEAKRKKLKHKDELEVRELHFSILSALTAAVDARITSCRPLVRGYFQNAGLERRKVPRATHKAGDSLLTFVLGDQIDYDEQISFRICMVRYWEDHGELLGPLGT